MSTRFEIPTALGPVWLWGRDTGRPILLVISGAFAEENFFCQIQDRFPEADVLRTHLPGNHCPELADTSIQAYATALDTALVALWRKRPVFAFGVSTGGLVALALRNPSLRQIVVIEPPLLTEGVWLFELFRKQAPEWGRTFVWNIFGVADDRMEPRDHTWVLDGLSTPTTALVGDEPLLPRRPFHRMPSLLTPATLTRLSEHPLVSVETIAGVGHHIPRDASMTMHKAVVRAWNTAFPDHPIET